MESEYAELAARVDRHRFEVIEITARIEELRQSIAGARFRYLHRHIFGIDRMLGTT